MDNVKIFSIMIGVIILAVIATAIFRSSNDSTPEPGKYDTFAQCLKDQGATFYGAFWCPHCQAQKKLFGTSASLLPYVECSMPNGSTQTAICTEKKIEGYPTWEFADGSRLSGEIELSMLAEKTTCQLPGEAAPIEATVTPGASSPVTPGE